MDVILKDPGAWIALGVSAISILAAVVMHRIFIRILKQPAPPEENEKKTGKEIAEP